LRAFPHVWSLDAATNATALDHLSRAIAIEPGYKLALARLWTNDRRLHGIAIQLGLALAPPQHRS
jgi:hypothetical protein